MRHDKNVKSKKKKDDRVQVSIKDQLKHVDIGVHNGVFVFTDPLTLGELAKKINKNASEIIKFFFLKGIMLTINDILSIEQIGEICLENNLDFKIEKNISVENILDNISFDDDKKDLKKRPPVVTIMGHVDHGKTTLLDKIRKSSIVSTEAGGITQHIGAYQIERNNSIITFIDTPGHEAFSEMRARGANITDIVILVVAADDGIKPQTEEAIAHAKHANVPIIVFVNKIDKDGANIDKVIAQLSEHDLVVEEWGGSTIMIKGSALTGQGIDNLLDAINLTAEMLELKANPNRLAYGTVIEANLDKGLGPIATVLVQNGTLQKTDYIVVGSTYGRIRLLLNDHKREINLATPATPVLIIGLEDVPLSGEKFLALRDEKEAKTIATKVRQKKIKEEQFKHVNSNIRERIASGEIKNVNVIIRADVHGSSEAIRGMIDKLVVDGANLTIIKSSIGGITESDIRLAQTSNAIIIGFNVRASRNITELANSVNVMINYFDVIYKLKEELISILKGSLDPIYEEKTIGEFQVLQTWKHSEVGTIAGGKIIFGKATRKSKCRVIRDGIILYKSEIASLKHQKDEIKECGEGKECGMVIRNFNDIKENDIIELFEEIQKVI